MNHSNSFERNAKFDEGFADRKLYFELVKVLFSTPKAILTAGLVACAMVSAAYFLTEDAVYFSFLIAYIGLTVFRFGATWFFRLKEPRPDDRELVRFWEHVALVGAWGFSGLSGALGAYTMLSHPNSEAETLINCCVIGYIAGISSRNASRPTITIGQISAICIPFTMALIARYDIVHTVLAIFISLLFLSTIMMARTMHENIISRHRATAELERIALYDSLTGLLGRTAFMRILDRQLAHADICKTSVALISIDLDRFKDVNDTFGHPAGDKVLIEAARRIESTLERGDVSRIGGDEFLIAISGNDPDEPVAVAERLLTVLAERITLEGTTVCCPASAGVAISSAGTSLDELLRRADLALYDAKNHGRGQVVSYRPAHSETYDERISLERDLQTCVAAQELELFYQPIVDPGTGQVMACEALLRWRHPTRGYVPPSDFIPIAESTGAIVPIGKWVLDTACREAMNWAPHVRLAVNLSPVQFRAGSEILESVRSALTHSGLSADQLDLEVTESVLMDDSATTLAIMEKIRSAGIGLSLDDFGTGFSSLGYLIDFPFSKVKIDRKFSQKAGLSQRAASIVRSIVQLTGELQIEVVAEGVETTEQLEFVESLGIGQVQGYFFSKPVPAQALHSLLLRTLRPVFAREPGHRQRPKVRTAA